MTAAEINEEESSEAARLESLWRGGFGDDYTDRNERAGELRAKFWNGLLARHRPGSFLEVGCNIGGNLQHVTASAQVAVGVDVNRDALKRMLEILPSAYAVQTAGRSLPFKSETFALTATVGVLIHQPEASLREVMSEIVRCSSRWVLSAEYFAPVTTEVSYRGVEGALFKRDYRTLFLEWFPELRVAEDGYLGPDDGFDDVTWYLFEKVGHE
ncbi:MAG: hypothetical protein QOG04_986 [Actinomycetota bacterium]|jgi:pseudaminic acid biosynthesis-associated methylase|nr:hypothetical protein [Actinomycetota bacterium]